MRYDDGTSRIGADPFSTPVAARDPVRRLRGRLASPVTVWTAFAPDGASVGLTVSSVLVAEGEPPELLGLLDPLSAFCEAVGVGGRFLVHVLTADQARTAERFALRFPGDAFEGEAPVPTPWGPALPGVATRAACTLRSSTDVGYARLGRAGIDEIALDERSVRPLVYYRGTYLTAGPPQG